jgi:nitroreductase
MIKTIKSRRSIRRFKKVPVSDDAIKHAIEAGIWAPSGMNNQPWRFAVIKDPETKAWLADLTQYGSPLKSAGALIAVFMDNSSSYDRTKDLQAMGACIQNMLLAIHSIGLGGLWIGEILKNRDKVEKLLGAPDDYELMAIVAMGEPCVCPKPPKRKQLTDMVFLYK